jgi:hypothetical protein
VPDLWLPGAAPASLADFVDRVHRQIEEYTTTHAAEQTEVEVELADGEQIVVQSLSPEPGYGFVTLTIHARDERGPRRLIVPLGSLRRISLGPAEPARAHFGFSLPETTPNRQETEPAA